MCGGAGWTIVLGDWEGMDGWMEGWVDVKRGRFVRWMKQMRGSGFAAGCLQVW
jgi:hypothetical protein